MKLKSELDTIKSLFLCKLLKLTVTAFSIPNLQCISQPVQLLYLQMSQMCRFQAYISWSSVFLPVEHKQHCSQTTLSTGSSHTRLWKVCNNYVFWYIHHGIMEIHDSLLISFIIMLQYYIYPPQLINPQTVLIV